MLKVGDYVIPVLEEEEYNGFLETLNIKYQDLFGIVTDVKLVTSTEGPRYSISIKSLISGEVSENWNAENFKADTIPDNLKDRYEYLLHTDERKVGTFKI